MIFDEVMRLDRNHPFLSAELAVMSPPQSDELVAPLHDDVPPTGADPSVVTHN